MLRDAVRQARQGQPHRIGAYLIEGSLEGGYTASVLKGRHEGLDCLFAIKLLDPLDVEEPDDSWKSRFQQEAQIGARLEHFVFAPVVDSGIDLLSRRPYFVMKLSDASITLEAANSSRDHSASARREGTLRDLCRDFAPLAQGLSFLHGKGIWHQDITLQNVLVKVDPQHPLRILRVYLIDFGNATERRTDGSFRFYPPTCVRGFWPPWQREPPQSEAEWTAIDLYQFGILLTTVIYGSSVVDQLSTSMETFPHGQRWVGPCDLFQKTKLPRLQLPELSGVLYGLTASNPAHRYQSALEVHDDLTCIAASQLPLTQPGKKFVSKSWEAYLWMKQAPVLFWSCCGFGLILGTAVTFSPMFTRVALNVLDERSTARRELKQAKLQRQQHQTTKQLWEIQDGLNQGRTDLTAHAMEKLRIGEEPKYRSAAVDFVQRWLEQEAVNSLAEFHGHRDPVRRIALTDDGASLISGGRDQRVLVWDISSRTLRHDLDLRTYGPPCDFSVSTAGTRLAIRTEPGAVLVIDLQRPDPLASAWILEHEMDRKGTATSRPDSGGTSIALRPDGRRVAWSDQRGNVWVAEIGEQTKALQSVRQLSLGGKPSDSIVGGLCFDGSGRYLALTSVQFVTVFDLEQETLQQITRRSAQNGNSRPYRFGEFGGKFLATDQLGEMVSIFEFADLDRREDVPVSQYIGYAAQTSTLSADRMGNIALTSRQENLVVLDSDRKNSWSTNRLPDYPVDIALAYSGERLAWTAGKSIRVSRLPSAKPEHTPVLEHHPPETEKRPFVRPVMALNPAGTVLATCIDGRTLHMTAVPIQPRSYPAIPITTTGKAVSFESSESVVFALRFVTSHELLVARLESLENHACRVRLSRVNQNAQEDWTNREIAQQEFPRQNFDKDFYKPLRGTFSENGEWLAIANLQSHAVVQLLPLIPSQKMIEVHYSLIENEGPRSQPATVAPEVIGVELDALGTQLFWMDSSGKGAIYDRLDPQVSRRIPGSLQDNLSARFSSGNRFFALSGSRGVDLRNSAFDPSQTTLETVDGPVFGLQFLGDAVGLVGGVASGELVVWDLQSQQLLMQRPLRSSPVIALEISRNNEWLATLHLDSHVCLWDVRSTSLFDFKNWHRKESQ